MTSDLCFFREICLAQTGAKITISQQQKLNPNVGTFFHRFYPGIKE